MSTEKLPKGFYPVPDWADYPEYHASQQETAALALKAIERGQAAIALLHKLEWAGTDGCPTGWCLACRAHSSDPAHKPGCELKALLDVDK